MFHGLNSTVFSTLPSVRKGQYMFKLFWTWIILIKKYSNNYDMLFKYDILAKSIIKILECGLNKY